MAAMTIAIGPAPGDSPKKKKMTEALEDEGKDSSSSEESDVELTEEEVDRAKELKALTGMKGEPEDIALAFKNMIAACGKGY